MQLPARNMQGLQGIGIGRLLLYIILTLAHTLVLYTGPLATTFFNMMLMNSDH